MKKATLQLIALLSICLFSISAEAQKNVNVTFKYVTINTITGYDHVSKLMVYCDDKKIGESSQKLQSKSNSITVKVPKGKHKLTASLYALYQNKWEQRTLANDYSFDFEYKKTGNWEVNNTINLTFDIADEVVTVTEKKPVASLDEDIDLETESVKSDTEPSVGNYTKELNEINEYLKTFDDGYYGYLEIIDGYLYDRFKSGKYSKSEIKYLGKAYEETEGKKVGVQCLNSKECVYSTYTDSYHTSIGFSQTANFNTAELIALFDNLMNAYNSTSTTSQSEKNSQNTIADHGSTGTTIKKGDKVIIRFIFSSDRNYSNKENYLNKKGTVVTLDYDDWEESYYGKIKLTNGEIVEFDDFIPELISSSRN